MILSDKQWKNPKMKRQNSDGDNNKKDGDVVIKFSKMSSSDEFEWFAKGLMCMKNKIDCDCT